MNESVRRATEILNVLRDADDLSARDLAKLIDLPKSTAQRLLQTLEACGLVQQNPVTRKYGLGPETLALGMAYLRRVNVRDRALPFMKRLCQDLGETVRLTVRNGDQRIFIEQIQPPIELRAEAVIGRPYPLWSGAPGRVLLAGMSPDELAAFAERTGEETFTHVEPRSLEGLRKALQFDQGVARAFGETIPGVNTIAAPIRNASGTTAAVLSVSGPASRFGAAEMDAATPSLVRVAGEISQRLGSSTA